MCSFFSLLFFSGSIFFPHSPQTWVSEYIISKTLTARYFPEILLSTKENVNYFWKVYIGWERRGAAGSNTFYPIKAGRPPSPPPPPNFKIGISQKIPPQIYPEKSWLFLKSCEGSFLERCRKSWYLAVWKYGVDIILSIYQTLGWMRGGVILVYFKKYFSTINLFLAFNNAHFIKLYRNPFHLLTGFR